MTERNYSARKHIRYSDSLEDLISMAVADGVLTEQERKMLVRKACEEGIDRSEFEMVLDERLRETQMQAADSGEIIDTRAKRAIMSSEKLAILLRQCKSNRERVNVIKDFPIPSTTDDLKEFIMTMSAKARNQGQMDNDGGDGYDEKRAYIAKYDEACLKAKTFFPGDETFSNLMQTTELSSSARRIGESAGSIFIKSFMKMYSKDPGDTLMGCGVVCLFIVLILMAIICSK